MKFVSGSMHLVLLVALVGYTQEPMPKSRNPRVLLKIRIRAVGDGTAKDTESIQKAIDTCARSGGGTVYFAPESISAVSLHLCSGVTSGWIPVHNQRQSG